MTQVTSSDQKQEQSTLTNTLLETTTKIVSAYVSNNPVSRAELPSLISAVDGALHAARQSNNDKLPEKSKPAVPIKQSLQDDYIICLEDGLRFRSLRRHLKSKYNMTPEQYRIRWNLPADYPMVCENYKKRRAQIAKEIGLGRKAGSKLK